MSRLITVSDDKTVDIIQSGDEKITVILDTEKAGLHYEFSHGHIEILIFHRSEGALEISDEGFIDDASVVIRYLELGRHDLYQKSDIRVGKDSELTVESVYLGTARKEIRFLLTNTAANSAAEISNNVVALDNADFFMEVTGKIEKDARYAKAHQKSRCLTIGSPKKALVKPVLLIDNNEVEASHSLSSGTIDEEVLFYMNSRGLDEKDALSLLLRSYLIPGEEFYEGFEMGEEISRLAREKVDDVCSM